MDCAGQKQFDRSSLLDSDKFWGSHVQNTAAPRSSAAEVLLPPAVTLALFGLHQFSGDALVWQC